MINEDHNGSTNNNKVVNGVWQYRLCLQAFVLVGEAFLFLLKGSKVHHKSAKWITIDLAVFC